MNKDNFEGTIRSAVGQGEKIWAGDERSVDHGAGLLRRCGRESAVGGRKRKRCSERRRRCDLFPGFFRAAR